MQVGDYLVLNIVAGKRVLAKCCAASKDGKRFKAMLEAKAQTDDEEPAFEFKESEVVANLGQSPTPGSVYGVKVEPMREHLDIPFCDDVNVHHEFDDKSRKVVKKAFHDAHAKLKAMKAPVLPIVTEIRTQVGAMMGFYRFRPKADKDILCIKLDDDLSDLEYRISHEYGHGLWYRHFTPQMKMAWVDMFHTSVEITEYSNADLLSLLEDLKTAGDLRVFVKDNPDDNAVIRAIFRHIKNTHAMEKSHFEMALMLGNDIDKYWPTAMELGEKQTILTTYARKSPEELFAEAFSLKFIGKKLPGKVDALLTKCMSRLTK